MTTADKVYAGIKLLDYWAGTKVGKNWRRLICLDELSFTKKHQCILGQLFGSYDRGIKILGLKNLGEENGFASTTNPEELRRCWVYVLDTQPTWSETRVIHGVKFEISKNLTNNKFSVKMDGKTWPHTYKNSESAKRAIRKRT